MRRLAALLSALALGGPGAAGVRAQGTSGAANPGTDPRQAPITVHIDGPALDQVVGPSFHLQGWAVLAAGCASGNADTVHLYLDGPAGNGRLLGAGTPLARADVAATFGCPGWSNAGFTFDVTGISPGAHAIYIYAFVASRAERLSVALPFTVVVP